MVFSGLRCKRWLGGTDGLNELIIAKIFAHCRSCPPAGEQEEGLKRQRIPEPLPPVVE
jgi:hypothetical protein